MFSKVFLAITQQQTGLTPPENTAYMALRFSSYGAGLSNIPHTLPQGSMLLLDDSTIRSHHPRQQLARGNNNRRKMEDRLWLRDHFVERPLRC